MKLTTNVLKQLKFSGSEIRDIVIISLIIGFIYSFTQWGTDKFDVAIGVKNLINAVIISGLGFLVHTTAQKISAIRKGYAASFEKYMPALLICLFVAILTNGFIKMIVVGGIVLTAVTLQRVGHAKPIIKNTEIATITLSGAIANIILALFFKTTMSFGMNPEIATKAISINCWIAIFSIIPVALMINPFLCLMPKTKLMPLLEGSTILFSSRVIFAFGAAFILSCSAIMLYVNALAAAIIAATIGLAIMIYSIYQFEL